MRLPVRTRGALVAAGVAAAVAAVPAAAVARPGDLDTSFGAGRGFVTTDVVPGPIVDNAEAVAVGPSGDAFVAGTSFQPGGSFPDALSLAHYTCCGLDSTFGVNGTATLAIGQPVAGHDVVYDTRADSLVTNDRVLVAGSIGSGAGRQALVVAFPRDGRSLDRSWDGDGMSAHGVPSGTDVSLTAVVPERNGRLVGAGTATFNGARRGFVARYLPDGRLDPSFSGDGVRTLGVHNRGELPSAVDVTDVAYDAARDRILVSGDARFAAGSLGLVLAVRGADAEYDRAFDGGARLLDLASGDDHLSAIALQPDGRPVVAGWSGTGGHAGVVTARLTTEGRQDTTYSLDGLTYYRPRTPARDVGATDVAVHGATGQITLTAFDRGGERDSDDDDTFTLLRYEQDGSRDGAFGSLGEVRTNLNPGVGGYEVANAIGLRNDGSVVAAGTSVPGGSWQFAVAVYANR